MYGFGDSLTEFLLRKAATIIALSLVSGILIVKPILAKYGVNVDVNVVLLSSGVLAVLETIKNFIGHKVGIKNL